MNVIEKGMWLRKFPKDAKSDIKILLNRVNFHEIKDMGNEDYVINIINGQDLGTDYLSLFVSFITCSISFKVVELVTTSWELEFICKNLLFI